MNTDHFSEAEVRKIWLILPIALENYLQKVEVKLSIITDHQISRVAWERSDSKTE